MISKFEEWSDLIAGAWETCFRRLYALVEERFFFIQEWILSRNWWHLLPTIPLIGVLIAVGTLAGMVRRTSGPSIIQHYREVTASSTLRRDHATTRVCLERLLDLGEPADRVYPILAQLAEEEGDSDYADAFWEVLAPPDRPGNLEAHVQRARKLLPHASPQSAAAQEAEHHLHAALTLISDERQLDGTRPRFPEHLQPVELEVRVALGQLYFNAGRLNDAERHLLAAVSLEAAPGVVALGRQRDALPILKARTLLGRLYTLREQYDKAERHLSVAAQRTDPADPQWLELQVLLARACIRQQMTIEAQPILERALACRQDNPALQVEAHALLGQVYLARQSFPAAEEQLRRALALPKQPATSLAHVLLGDLLLQTGRVAEAEQHLRTALAMDRPENFVTAQAQVHLGWLCLNSNRLAEAEQLLSQAIGNPLLPSDPAIQARGLLGRLYALTQRETEAETLLRAVVVDRPEEGLALARLLNARGKVAEAVSFARRAEAAYRQRSLVQPLNPWTRIRWAEAAAARLDFAEAEAVLRTGMCLRPALAAAASFEWTWGGRALQLHHLASAIVQSDSYRASLVEIYRSWLVEVEKESTAASTDSRLVLLERLLLVAPDATEGCERLVQAVQATGQMASLLTRASDAALTKGEMPFLSRLLLACQYLARSDEEKGRHLLDEAVRHAPTASRVLLELAKALAQQPAGSRYVLALVDTVLQQDPASAACLLLRGQALARLERWQEARRDLEAALAGLHDPREAHQALAEVYRRLGDPTKASEHEQRARLSSSPQKD